MHNSYNIKGWDYFVGIIFILTSGTMIWFHLLTPKYAYIIYFFVCFINALKKTYGKPLLICNHSLIFCCYTIIFAIIGSILFYYPYAENTTSGYIISMLGSYLLISHSNFYQFRHIITNIIYYIVLFGVPIFLLTELDLLPLKSIKFQTTTYQMFLIYSIGWPNIFHRFAGIWHEPGACQIFMNVILWLHLDELINWKWEKGQLKKIIIITIGLLCTFSTGGYLALMILVYIVVSKIKLKGKYKKLIKLFIFSCGILIIICIFHSNVVQEKLFTNEQGLESSSKQSRLIENLAMLSMFIEKPILGWGLGSEKQIIEFIQRDNGGCSNGILYMACSWGLMWIIPFFLMVYRTIKKINLSTSHLWLLLAFILLESNERYLEFPISFLFVFSFYSYKRYYVRITKTSVNLNYHSNIQLRTND